jgi:hypothetical protein
MGLTAGVLIFSRQWATIFFTMKLLLFHVWRHTGSVTQRSALSLHKKYNPTCTRTTSIYTTDAYFGALFHTKTPLLRNLVSTVRWQRAWQRYLT